jgi:anti-anti-sigma factor
VHIFRLDMSTDVVFHAQGELDLTAALELAQASRSALRDGARALRLDLTNVVEMDAAALGVLIDLRRAAVRRRATLDVVCGAGAVHALFAATRTEKLLGVQAS